MSTEDDVFIPAFTIPVKIEGFSLEEIEGELLLYSPNQTKTIYLNQSATIIWQLCDGSREIEEIETMLLKTFPDAAEAIPKDLRSCLDSLRNDGAIRFTAAQTG